MSKIIKPNRFVGLHAHTHFSPFDGLGVPQDHINFVLENQMDAMAITEHGNMNSYSHAHLHTKELNSKGVNFKYIPGCEFYLHPDLEQWKLAYEDEKEKKKESKAILKQGTAQVIENEEETRTNKTNKYLSAVGRRHHLIVLAKNSAGLKKLFNLVSQGYIDGFYKFPRIDYSMLKAACADSKDLIVSTACIGGPIAWDVFKEFSDVSFDNLKPALLNNKEKFENVIKRAENSIDQIIDAVGVENFFLELQFNKLNAQHLANRAIISLAKKNNIKLIAAADSHYCRPEYWKDRELYKKLGRLNFIDLNNAKLPDSVEDLKCELYPKNADQMWQTYQDTKQDYDFYDDELVCDAINRTHDITHQFIGDINPDTSVKLPSSVVPKNKTDIEELIELCKQGLKDKNLDKNPVYVNRVKHELKIVKDKDFSKYFLTMKRIVDVAKSQQLVGPGRGSSAGSLINYILDITEIDPIKYDLIFERFYGPHRHEAPDIDTDFADRDSLIEALRIEFGAENVLYISNYNTMQLKSLIKDISKFYGVPFSEVNTVTKNLEKDVKNKVLKAGDDKNFFSLTYNDSYKYSQNFKTFIDKYPHIGQHAKILFGQNRSLGKHAGGVIISDNIDKNMPVIMSRGERQTPWTEGMARKDLENYGWIKFDLLGLSTLRIIQRCIELVLMRHYDIKAPTFDDIKDWYDKNLHPDVVNLNDQKVYKHVYGKGNFAATFQCTERGAQNFFKRSKPTNIIEIATLTSIYRPGPLNAKVDKIYLDAKRDPDSVEYVHDLVKNVLHETYGTIVFQESIMNLAHVVAGFTLAECDKLRKAILKRSASGMSKAKKEAIRLEKLFIEGAQKNGLTEQEAIDLFEQIAFFAGYGFNKSHAVSYAMVSYMCSYMLTHYEPEWLCAYMESVADVPGKRAKAINEIRSFGYDIVKIDINHATTHWTILENRTFMPSFLTCKGIGLAAISEIEQYRPYKNIEDFLWNKDGSWKHSKLNKRVIDSLIKINGFSSLEIVGEGRLFKNARQMYFVLVENMNKIKQRTKNNPYKGMNNFYELIKESKDIEDWTTQEKLDQYMELIGDLDLELLLPPKLRQKLVDINIKCVDDYNSEDIYWCITSDVNYKKTKKGKPYTLLSILGEQNRTYKTFVWNCTADTKFKHNTLYIAKLKKSDFGFSTSINNIKELNLATP
tara:strand:+ start:1067 stop:4606 length:3540 start_codon:yes stop_codon:yes gene_type:complete